MVKPLKIVPPEIQEGQLYQQSQGTQVFAGDEKVHGITGIDISIPVGGFVEATIKTMCWFDEMNNIEPCWVMVHPFTGKTVRVDKIVLRSGETIDLSTEVDITNLDSTARELRRKAAPSA